MFPPFTLAYLRQISRLSRAYSTQRVDLVRSTCRWHEEQQIPGKGPHTAREKSGDTSNAPQRIIFTIAFDFQRKFKASHRKNVLGIKAIIAQ